MNQRCSASGFFPVLNIPILDGRNFTDGDDANAQPVTIVNESFAHKYWPGENAVGKYISILRETPVLRRVVGVVGNVRATIEDEPPPAMYVCYKQTSFPSMQVVLLRRDASGSARGEIRQAVQSVDPEQPADYATSMDEIVRSALDPWRFALALLAGLAGLAGIAGFAALVVLPGKRRGKPGRRLCGLIFCLCILATLATLPSCGGISDGAATGTYPITVTATFQSSTGAPVTEQVSFDLVVR